MLVWLMARCLSHWIKSHNFFCCYTVMGIETIEDSWLCIVGATGSGHNPDCLISAISTGIARNLASKVLSLEWNRKKSCESSSDGIGILAFWTFEITRPSWKCNLIARRWEISRMVYIVHMTCVVMVQYFISLWVDFLVTFCRVITSQQIISSYWRFLNSVN